MKAWVDYTKKEEGKEERVEEINTLADLLELLEKEETGIIIEKNWAYHSKADIHESYLKELKKSGCFECELSIEVYNDYRE